MARQQKPQFDPERRAGSRPSKDRWSGFDKAVAEAKLTDEESAFVAGIKAGASPEQFKPAVKQSFFNKIRDIVDANTETDKAKRKAEGRAEDYKKSVEDTGDRAYTNPIQAAAVGFVKPGAKAVNTLAGAVGKFGQGVSDLAGTAAANFGSDEDYKKAEQRAIKRGKEDIAFSGKNAGLLGAGTNFKSGAELEDKKKLIGATLKTGSDLASYIPAGSAAKTGASLTGKAAAKQLATEVGSSVLTGAGSQAGDQLSTRGKLDFKELAKSGAINGAIPLVTFGLGRGVRKVGKLGEEVNIDIPEVKQAEKAHKIAKSAGLDVEAKAHIVNGEPFDAKGNPITIGEYQRLTQPAYLTKMEDEINAGTFKGKTFKTDRVAVKAGEPHVIEGKVKKDAAAKELLTGLSQAERKQKVASSLAAAEIDLAAKKLGVKADIGFANRLMTDSLKDPKEIALAAIIKTKVTDPTYALQKQIDPTIPYRENYIPGVYDATAEAKDQAIKALRQKTNSNEAKVFNSYEEAAQFGLAPKYKSVSSLVAANQGEAIAAVERAKVIDKGIQNGVILPMDKAPGGWTEVMGMKTPGGSRLFAEKKFADTLNNALQEGTSNISKGLKLGRKLSSGFQEITLSGGIPGTVFNMYVGGQVMKDLLGAGRVSVLKDVLLSSTKKMTQERFVKKADFVKKLTDAGADLTGLQSSLTKEGAGRTVNTWHNLIDRPTFERFVPNTKLTVAENTFKKLKAKGLTDDQAIQIAAKTTNVFNGVVDNLANGRSLDAQNAIGTVFFAPKYREGIINTLANSVKAWSPKNIKDPSYAMSRRLAVGTLTTAILYDQVNRAINGHGMLENPKGKELTLQIPYGDDQLNVDAEGNPTQGSSKKTINIPLFPSYLTLPRSAFGAIKSALSGDVKGAIGEGGKSLSSPLQFGSQVISNKDYFGKAIRNDQANAEATGGEADSTFKQLLSVGSYGAKQLSPGWVRAGMDAAGGKPTEQVLAQAFEAPVRFGKIDKGSMGGPESYSSGEVGSAFYDAVDILKNQRYKANDKVTQAVEAGDYNRAQRLAQEYNQKIAERFQIFFKKYGNSSRYDPKWDDTIENLLIKTTPKALNSRKRKQ